MLDSFGGLLSLWKHHRGALCAVLAVGTVAGAANAQTYKVGAGSVQKVQNDADKTTQQKSLGWGSNIENARLARAAEQALKAGNYSSAVDYAQRAAQGAPNDPHLWFLLGYAARLNRRSQLSIDAYNHGLRLDPSSLDGLSGLAQTYNTIGRRDEAERLLTQVLAADPKRSNDAEVLGEILLRDGQYDQSLAVLKRAEAMQPSARVELLMALSYERLKQFADANHELELARKRAPDNPEVERALAGFYRETGNYPAAIAELKRIHPASPEVKAELAYTYQLDGEPEESAKLYTQAADAVPGDLNLQLSAAQAELAAGSVEHSEAFLKRAASIDADQYRLHAIRGEIARLEEHNQDAIHEYNAALAHLPESPAEGPLYGIQLHLNLVELYKNLQDDAAFHNHLNTAQLQIGKLDEHGPGRSEFLRLRAMIKMYSGDLDGAGGDIREALALKPKDPNNLQLSGDLLMKLGRPQEAIGVYRQILATDAGNRFALTSLGFASREAGNDKEAEKYFDKLASAHPKLYVPYLALGDLYAARRDFTKAQSSYRKAFDLAPANSLIVAGGMNAAIEAKRFPLAAEWLGHATPEMRQNPFVMREQERYLSWTGDYQQSADVGREAIKKLPRDRDVVVYLGYDLLHLERYDELQNLTSRYDSLLPKEADIPLLAGYVHKHEGQLEDAQQDFTRAIARDPKVVTAYVNRGYVLKDLHKPNEAAADFQTALQFEPKNGEAHLGLAYTSLDLHHPRVALRQVQLAYREMGDSMAIHLIRATAYGDEGSLTKAAAEYHIALKSAPNDGPLHLALGDTLYGLNRYSEAIVEFQTAGKLSPGNSLVYAKLARSYAQLHDRDNTMRNVQLAESHTQENPKEASAILLSTGEALSQLGDQAAAMHRFEAALEAPESDRIEVRLAIAKHMVAQGQLDDARRQIALGLMEARTGEAPPPTGHEWIEAADLFLSMHDFQLAESYYQHALATGTAETEVRIGLANTYLALGDTARAEAQLSLVDKSDESDPTYQYLLAKASVYRQQHHNTQALTAFAQAADAAGEDPTADRELMQAAGDEGLRITPNFSFLSDFSVSPIFEDTTVYPLDAKLDVSQPIPGRQSLLPTPRSSIQTEWTGAYHLHFGNFPDASGFFQVRNAQGQISLPSANAIVNRDTTDYSFNFGLNPSLHFGNNVLTFDSGIQETIRRDSADPFGMNQNLFRQFLYMSTSSFFNMVSVSGYAIREAGPFTESNLNSRDLSGAVNFRVGRPWGKTFFLTGWGARDDQFNPVIREFYYTSVYAGIERRVSNWFTFRALAEHLRSWRVEGTQYAIAQALRPAGSVQFTPTRNWRIEANVAYSRNMGFHAYDAVQSGFAVSYALPIHKNFKDEGKNLGLVYPIRFSAGLQQENFYDFPGSNSQQFRPYVSITIF
ncbi:MAG: tetratricopeptide repeat protein [Terriglobales bacterium]